MAILVNKNTKIMVQGITGTQASFHIQRAMNYGTNVVAGVVPHTNEEKHLGVPLFSTVAEAKKQTGANSSIIFVPAKYAKSAILEAIDANLELVVVITAGIPVNDMMEIRHRLEESQTILIGPNTPGVITPFEAYMGIFPDNIYKSGNIGIISRSSTLTYEVILEINKTGLGESTIVGLGDDAIIGTGFSKILQKFHIDSKTKAIVLIGGIGGNYELEIAQCYNLLKKKKKVIALLTENNTSFKTHTGVASDILCRGITSIADKRKQLESAGIIVVDNISDLKTELLKI